MEKTPTVRLDEDFAPRLCEARRDFSLPRAQSGDKSPAKGARAKLWAFFKTRLK